MKTPLVIIIMTLTMSASAVDYSVLEQKGVDYSYFNSAPSIIAEAAKKNAITDRDSTPAVVAKREAFCKEMIEMEKNLLNKYYSHPEMNLKDLEAIDRIAQLRANIEYPLFPSAGASGHDGIYLNAKRELICEIVAQTASAIQATKPEGLKVVGPACITPAEWAELWNKIQWP